MSPWGTLSDITLELDVATTEKLKLINQGVQAMQVWSDNIRVVLPGCDTAVGGGGAGSISNPASPPGSPGWAVRAGVCVAPTGRGAGETGI